LIAGAASKDSGVSFCDEKVGKDLELGGKNSMLFGMV
jgi:hypothetical protein